MKKLGKPARGHDHQYRSDMVIFYTDGRLACGPRVIECRGRELEAGRRYKVRRRDLQLCLRRCSLRFMQFPEDRYPF